MVRRLTLTAAHSLGTAVDGSLWHVGLDPAAI